MITAKDLEVCPLFTCIDPSEVQRFAERAADVRLAKDEWLIREGEQASFFILLEGETQAVKDIVGRETELSTAKPGIFFGELPVLFMTPFFVSVRAKERSRLARFSPQLMFELIQSSEKCAAMIMKTMMDRVSTAQQWAKEIPASRVLIVGTQYDRDCREIRAFLSANRIPYEWIDHSKHPELVPSCMKSRDGH